MRLRPVLWHGLLFLALGAFGVHGASALSCAPPSADPKVRAQTQFAQAAVVFVGQLIEVGGGINEGWSVSAIGRLKAERWFKGAEAAEVRVLLPLGFRPGDRLLVFARTNPPADRLRQTEGPRRYQRLDGKPSDTAASVPDAEMPDLTAAQACDESAFPLSRASLSAVPSRRNAAGSDRIVILTNEMLKVLETLPTAGSGGRLN